MRLLRLLRLLRRIAPALPGSARCILGAAALVAFGASRTGAFADARASSPVRMSVLGDSLAFGTGASDPRNALAFRVYAAVLADRPGSEVTNQAIGGTRVADIARLEVPQLDARADLVLVIAGGNDVIRHTPLAQFARDERRLLAAIRLRAPHARIVVCGVPDVARSPLFADSFASTEAASRGADRIVRQESARVRAWFVDLFAFTHARVADPEFFSSDDFHPSDAGYAELAGVVVPIVRRALRAEAP